MIQVERLTKVFGSFTAVNNLSFATQVGEVLGFLGPNGAGKSTTMKMITGFLNPSHGQVIISPQTPVKDFRQSIGYLPEGAPIYGDMTVDAYLHFVAQIRGFSGKAKRAAVDRVIELLHLESVRAQLIEILSKGFTRRVGLAQALIHDPEILILDEPTDGLDPNQKHHVRELIRSFAATKLVIVSTHILEEVSAVCNRALIIAHGELRFDGTPQELSDQALGAGSLMVEFAANSSVTADDLKQLPEIAEVEVHGGHTFRLLPQSSLAMPIGDFIQLSRNNAWEIKDIYRVAGRLDEVFRRFTTGNTHHVTQGESA